MILTTQIPSFYVVELDGEILNDIVGSNFNLNKLVITSNDFANDLEVVAALDMVMEKISPNKVKPVQTFNPDFFPSLDPIKLTDQQIQENKDFEDALLDQEPQESDGGALVIKIPITRNFDPMGDFVILKSIKRSSKYGIIGKVVADTSWYVGEITKRMFDEDYKDQKIRLN